MAENVGGIVYNVDIDTAKTVSGTKSVNKELDNLEKGFNKTDAAAKKASGGMDGFSKTTKSASSESAGFSAKLTPLAAAIGGLISIQALMNMQRMAEQFTILSARITRLSTDSAEAAKTYRALLNISSQTGANIANTVGLWESLTGTLKEMGRTNSDVLRLTETLQKIGTLGGSSAEDMSNALRQLGQGLAGGVIRAEEFNSVLEGMPELARQIAKGLGIPFSELRQRMLDGQLTAEDVLAAIENRTKTVNDEFAKIPRTVSQATNSIVNEMGAAIAAIDKAAGASAALATALDAIAKGVRLTAGNLTDQERLNELFAERQKIVESLAKSEGTWRENMPGAVALREKLKKLDMELLDIQNRRIAEQKKESAPAAVTPEKAAATTSEDGQKALESMRAQLELSKLQGEARVRLAAIQKLGAGATAEERAEAEKLAAEIYRLDEAQKKAKGGREQLTEAQKEAKKSAEELASAQEQDVKVITDMAEALYQSSLGATELAQRQSELALSEYATQDQISSVKQLASELQRVKDIESLEAAAKTVTPLRAAENQYTTDLGQYQAMLDAKLISDQEYLQLKGEAEKTYDEQRLAAQSAIFANMSLGNTILMDSINALGASSAQVLSGVLSGTMNGQEAMQSLANTIFQSVISSFVQMGVEQVKAALIGKAASAAAAAGYVASVSGQVAANTALAAQAAFASTAAIPIIGPAAAPAAAAAAGAAAGALGAPAIGAAASTVAGRALGGPVQANQMYRVNETGGPEIFNAANGRQYMMPNQQGEVVSNKDATEGSGQANVIVNIQNNAEGSTATATSRTDNRQTIIDVVVSDIMSNGKIGQSVNRITGQRRAGG